VGHESDVTIADFVADVRAATPTMAAEIAVPARVEVLARIAGLERMMAARLSARVESSRRRADMLTRSYALGRVRSRIEQAIQRLDHAQHRAERAAGGALGERRARVDALTGRMAGLNPRDVLRRGYAVVVDPAHGTTLASASDAVRAGDVHLVFNDGAARAHVSGRADSETTPAPPRVREVSK
jgi:exodeoxyribonuclease VII large subunit